MRSHATTPALKPYSIEKGKGYIDWYNRLEYLKSLIIANTPVDKVYMVVDRYYNDAKDWVTCACGNQCAAIPRSEDSFPKDKTLRDLGMEFYNGFDLLREELTEEIYREGGTIIFDQVHYLDLIISRKRKAKRNSQFQGLTIKARYVPIYETVMDLGDILNFIEHRSGELLIKLGLTKSIKITPKPQ